MPKPAQKIDVETDFNKELYRTCYLMTYYLYIIYKVIKSTNNDGFNENYLKFLELQENRKKNIFQNT